MVDSFLGQLSGLEAFRMAESLLNFNFSFCGYLPNSSLYVLIFCVCVSCICRILHVKILLHVCPNGYSYDGHKPGDIFIQNSVFFAICADFFLSHLIVICQKQRLKWLKLRLQTCYLAVRSLNMTKNEPLPPIFACKIIIANTVSQNIIFYNILLHPY